MNSKQMFYIVSTPIGNLKDMSYRAVDVLKSVDVILCEDTRVTGLLCKEYGIETPKESYHAHSSEQQHEQLLSRIQEGTTFALVSDAGTPTISDPGVKLISLLREKLPDVDVVNIPGPTALITALSTTGFSGNDFRFFGFIPHKKGRESFFNEIAEHHTVAVCYESPHRIMKTLQSIVEHEKLSQRKLCIARELTKMFEQKRIGAPKDILSFFEDNEDQVRGEFVLVFDRID
jgi:16S rRNA (cytidine1402-2'-O)-methyltransferase